MFENQTQGVSKASHERMLNDRGRKIVKERMGGNQRNFDHFKNIHSNDAENFDQDWNRVAGQLGFNPGSNMLEYGGGQNDYKNYGRQARGNAGLAEARGLGVPEGYAESRGLGYVDDGRRGHYIPSGARGQNAPVRMNNDYNQNRRDFDARSIRPTVPSGRVEPLGPPQRGSDRGANQAANQPPRAIAARPNQAAAPRQNNAGARAGPPPRINNYQAPQQKGPARAG